MLLVSAFLLVQLQATAEEPALIARQVRRALEGDSVAVLVARWRGTIAASPNDRTALFGLATAARLTDAFDAAERLYDKMVARTPDAVDRSSAFARLGIGLGLLARSRYERADSALSRTIADARRVGAADVDAEALMALSQLRMRTVDATAARALLDSAVRRLTNVKPALLRIAPLEAQRTCSAASVHVRLATPGAGDTARAGAAQAKRAGEPGLEGQCLFIVAQEYERQGKFDSATFVLRTRVEPLLRRAKSRQSLSAVLQWGGYLALRVGRYSLARKELLEAVSLAEASNNESVLAWAHLGLANIALDLGDGPTTAFELGKARALLTAQGTVGDSQPRMRWRQDSRSSAVGRRSVA